jgi:cephalosporin-C deacetylase-like acetyl esterase
MSLGSLPGGIWAFRHLAYGPDWTKITLRPIPEPSAPDAIGLDVRCANADFLLPGSQPVHFDVAAVSYARSRTSGRAAFQVCDYLTRKPLAERVTPFELDPGRQMAVPTDVPVSRPGPYRGRIVLSDGRGQERSIEWVFTYDFPNYRPPLTRQPDFEQFWKDALAELAAVPMDAKVTPVPDQSTDTAEAFRVSLATLGGRRVWCWYWKPRKPGRYPVQFQVPSSGVYPLQANQIGHGDDYCGMWMAIHGLPVDYDPKNPPQDPAAWNYWTHGISSPKTSMWRTIYASMVRGVDFLCSRAEVDPKRIMVGGGSQGGGLSMVLAGLDRRISLCAPAHSGLARLDWTVIHAPGFWPFGMNAKPAGQSTEQFLATLSYFDAANFTPQIACPVVAEVSLLDTVTASGNQICALAHVKPGQLELICDPWTSHA